MTNIVDVLATERVFAIVRTTSAQRAVSICADLLAGGVAIAEITMNTPGALMAIAQVKGSRLADRTDRSPSAKLVGAGTVLTAADAGAAATAGADFLVTPAVITEVLTEAARIGLPVLCGAYTMTEAHHAWQNGAAAVKLFPAAIGGPAYLSALRAPLPEIPFVAVGAVAIDTVPAYLSAGAIAAGLGSPLLHGDIAENCARLREVLS